MHPLPTRGEWFWRLCPTGPGVCLRRTTSTGWRRASAPCRCPRAAWCRTREDLRGAGSIFLLVFLSTFPVALPFMLIGDVGLALRISNAIAVVLLFLVGTGLGRYMNWHRPWAIGLAVACFGAILVAITIALGG